MYKKVSNIDPKEYRFEVTEKQKLRGVKRILIFCLILVLTPSALIIIPLYLKKHVFADVIYQVAESDIIEIRDGISSTFCEAHTLRMNSNFNAFQLRNSPEVSTNTKHIRLKKSMTLPDDTLEYWGFYLLKGAKVHLKFCSRYDGSRILVVKGEKELKTCGLLDHNKNKPGANFAKSSEHVKVFFEEITELDTPSQKTNPEESIDSLMESENSAAENLNDEYLNNNKKSIMDEVELSKRENLSSFHKGVKKKKLKKGTLTPSKKDNLQGHRSQKRSIDVKSTNFLSKQVMDKRSSKIGKTFFSVKNKQQILGLKLKRQKARLYEHLYKHHQKRDVVYDRKYSHGGNAVNFTQTDESNSVSSFESALFECYNGDILLAEGFKSSMDCLSTYFLENGTHRMITNHDILQDGYYYYIFYSDNDVVRNDIHAIFDIYKPTFQYSNLSNSQSCVNSTNCTFTKTFLSDEMVVVEVPTRDGIEHDADDITNLISTCNPRKAIYLIFPISVLFLILSFSFI